MNIIEAINSGKKYKRKSDTSGSWYLPSVKYQFKQECVLADDWEVEEEKKELSWDEIKKVLDFQCIYLQGYSPNFQVKLNYTSIKKELGFKE